MTYLKLKLAVVVLDFGLGGEVKNDGAFCQSIRDELRGAFYNCGPALKVHALDVLGVQQSMNHLTVVGLCCFAFCALSRI